MCHFIQPSRLVALVAVFNVATVMSAVAADDPAFQPRGAVRQAGGAMPTSPQAVSAPAQATHAAPLKSQSEIQPPHRPLPLPGAHNSDSPGDKAASGSRTFGALVTVVVSLAVVLGLFGACAWLMRRGLPSNARTLPSEAVSVLGRAPLAGRQQMHLVRFGNKMLLVCVSPSGVDSLGEITDVAEIDRIAGLCEQTQTASATAAFKQIFGQVARDRSPARWLAGKSAARKEAADV
jgi:flagellar biogenesis protein FliO